MSSVLPSIAPESTPPTMSITISPTPSPTGSSGGGGGTQNSPLLFFVALGFGVVFTNLWIIVGVKYCFRYNARNRARANGVDEVDLQAIGARPHRRRREKKLMTVDEVNERFPVTKYKTWRANREVLGLPTTGGIAPTDGSAPVVTAETQSELEPPASPLPKIPEPVADPTKPTTPERESHEEQERPIERTENQTQPPATRTSTEIARVQSNRNSPADHDHDSNHDDDEPMSSLPADMANSCGDTCAICIDNLEDSDDVRGLTCGHAFHTACIDPWLTARRASCPLCKADYYVPKPRTEAEIEAEEAARERRRQQAAEIHRHPLSAWWYRAENYLLPTGTSSANRTARHRNDPRRRSQGPRWNPFGRSTNAGTPAAGAPEVQQAASSGSFLGRFRRQPNPDAGTNPSPATEEPTPGTLEAGLANNNSTSGTR
ncbi:hypothetical protein H072_5557 [Dactylellina haptotyla CBS 200.50]|uniref:RING-type E3 ubiquitin transferase n=1 Tax=Dactylellina haptotyla (strain CBS 200.50) TaxID=1284197 RepID=S8ACC2_DACHA|nr:hypothetical protein H072_5557 [Dactylellina haptotyla CBS 200.50]